MITTIMQCRAETIYDRTLCLRTGVATEPMDMRSGTEKALARVVAFFGAAQSHGADLCKSAWPTNTDKTPSPFSFPTNHPPPFLSVRELDGIYCR